MAATTTKGLEIYNTSGNYNSGALIFSLDPSSVTVDDQKAVEVFELPGNLWNTAFDSISVEARWTISGTFYAKNADWDATNYEGRAWDFIHSLRSALKSITPNLSKTAASGGAYAGTYANIDCFRLVFNQNLGGTIYGYNVNEYYLNADSDLTKRIQFVPVNLNFKITGGSPGVVEYTLTFLEISDILRLG